VGAAGHEPIDGRRAGAAGHPCHSCLGAGGRCAWWWLWWL
ncbi:MAG: hypothetical protein AVDCRST_MAG83-2236, partial [uncultured Arthrobacter sp.]